MNTIRTIIATAAILLVASPSYAASEPAITAGRIITPSINVAEPPGQIAISLTLKYGTVGISTILPNFTSPDGTHNISNFISPPMSPIQAPPKTFTAQIASPFANGGLGIFSEPGAWTLTSILLVAKDNTTTYYTGSQLSALFPSLTVTVTNNGTPDTKPPIFGNGLILTPTVSISSATPYFVVRMAVADAISGVANASITFTAPASNGGFPVSGSAYVSTLAPLQQGNVTAISQAFTTSSPTGTYTITNYTICDYANNCLSDNLPADIEKKFGTTTFQVTN